MYHSIYDTPEERADGSEDGSDSTDAAATTGDDSSS